MTHAFEHSAELHDLLDALCEETLSAEQMRRLEELVLAHPEAEACYVQYMSFYADLAGHFAGARGGAVESLRGRIAAEEPQREARSTLPLTPPERSGWRRARLLLWAVAGVAGVAAAVWFVLLRQPPPRTQTVVAPPTVEAEPIDNTVAVLLQVAKAEWKDNERTLRPGAVLSPGWLHLKSGLAQIEFYSGATVILEGPVDLQLISAGEAYCAGGKLRAIAPAQAQGFTIRSPRLDVVDRGTEFGLQVGDGNRAEVHVFKGKVELYNPGSQRDPALGKELTTGRGLRLDGPGDGEGIPSDPHAFVSAEEVATRSEEVRQERHRDWLAASEVLRREPGLLVYYSFQTEPEASRTLLDLSGTRQEPCDGTIVGCRWGTGRWQGKRGLEFRHVSDRVRFHVPGEFAALTLMAWVRVDALPNRYNSLMMTDGWEQGAPHWHIHSNGRVALGVKGHGPDERNNYYSPKIFAGDRLGQWTHLTVVFDPDSRCVTHYLDGKAVAVEKFKFDTTLQIGDAELGNWNLGSRTNETCPIRYLNGCIDEFLMFSRALSEEEIQRMYNQGRPPL